MLTHFIELIKDTLYSSNKSYRLQFQDLSVRKVIEVWSMHLTYNIETAFQFHPTPFLINGFSTYGMKSKESASFHL